MDKKNFDKEFIIEEELKKLPAMGGSLFNAWRYG